MLAAVDSMCVRHGSGSAAAAAAEAASEVARLTLVLACRDEDTPPEEVRDTRLPRLVAPRDGGLCSGAWLPPNGSAPRAVCNSSEGTRRLVCSSAAVVSTH